jgi:hypothetical protein
MKAHEAPEVVVETSSLLPPLSGVGYYARELLRAYAALPGHFPLRLLAPRFILRRGPAPGRSKCAGGLSRPPSMPGSGASVVGHPCRSTCSRLRGTVSIFSRITSASPCSGGGASLSSMISDSCAIPAASGVGTTSIFEDTSRRH